jgi:hypothetical protein
MFVYISMVERSLLLSIYSCKARIQVIQCRICNGSMQKIAQYPYAWGVLSVQEDRKIQSNQAKSSHWKYASFVIAITLLSRYAIAKKLYGCAAPR